MSSDRPSFLEFLKNKKKERQGSFFGLKLILLIWKMSIITAFPGVKRSWCILFAFLPFLDLFSWNWPSYFPPDWVCVDLVTMSCCFQAPRQWCWCFRPPVLRFLVIFFHPTDRPTQNQETYSTLNERKGDDLSLMVSFWASSPHCFCVFLYTCLLFCFVLFLSVK